MAYYEELFNTKHHRKCGNHRAKVEYCGKEKYCIKFYYFNTCICLMDFSIKAFILSDGGWNTISTHKAIMNYYRFLRSKGFHLNGLYLSGFYGMPKDFIKRYNGGR